MRVEELSLVNFRNLAKITLEVSGRVLVLRGGNGQGKTNLLEALYVCATGRSFRNASPRELLRLGATHGSIHGRFERRGVRHQVEATFDDRHRHLRIDDRGVRSMAKLLELVNVVAFFPDDLRIAKGAPEERRRFIDRAVANYRPEFVDAALAYARALRSRNALLRAERAPSRELLAAYDEQLVERGSVMQRCREEALAILAPAAALRFARIMPGTPPFSIELLSGLPAAEEPYSEALRRALSQSFPRDRARGSTSVGPHRADLVLRLGDEEARAYASQGQQRAMVLALKLAELSCLSERLDSPPILLLDDVSSELDTERTRLLFDALAEIESQLWVSTTGAAPLPLPADAQMMEVSAGTVQPAR